jgi:hypothetical protein
VEVIELALSRRLLSWSGRKSWGKSRPPLRGTENFASRREGTYGLVCAAQQLEINIGKRLVKLSYLKLMQLGRCGGRLLSRGEGCCVVLWVWFGSKENVREPEAKSSLMVVARSLVRSLLVRFGHSPRMECNQMNLCRVCAAVQA